MEWTRGPTLGQGSTAAVSLATSTTTNHLFAVKSTDINSSVSLRREELIISKLDSPYVIKYLGSDTTCHGLSSLYNLFLEYHPNGSLCDHITKHGCISNEASIKHYAHQILQALDYIHCKGIVHCDIKGSNILIGDDGKLKIADFGCAKWNGESASFAGTPAYMSPEVARGEEQGFPADIWGLGCTVIEMATGCNPWPEMKDPAAALYRIGFTGDVPEVPMWFSDEGKDFVGKCLMRDSKVRWTAGELLEHPFFDKVERGCLEIRKSPTSVMERGFWSDVEELDSSRNFSTTVVGSCFDDVLGRVGALIGDEFESSLEFPDWDEEDWLTVRCNEIEEGSKVESYEDLFVDEEEMLTSIEDSLLDCFDDEISHVDEHDSSSSSTFLVIRNNAVKYEFVLRIIEFQTLLMELFFHIDHLFMPFFEFSPCKFNGVVFLIIMLMVRT